MTKVGSLRASDADREEIITRLRRAATEGRIAAEELEQRVSAALKARTYSELDATVADLPGQGVRRPRRETARRRSAAGWALSTARANPLLVLLALPMVVALVTVVVTALVMWAVLMVVVMMIGGRRQPHRRPRAVMYTRYRRPYGPPRRSPRSYWA